MPSGTLMTPRPVPGKLAPALAALLVLGVALPVFLLAGWDVRGWALGAVLWVGLRGLSLLIDHVRKDSTSTAASGLQAFELAFKALAVLVVLLAVATYERGPRAARDPRLRARLHGRARAVARHVLREHEVKRALAFVTTLALVLPAVAAAQEEEEFDPAHEWELQEWVPIHIGPLDMSINKAVAYLMLGTVVSIVLGIVLMRVRLGERPDRRQTVGEIVYEVAQVQVAEQGLPTKAIGRWFPYVASLLIFVWVLNMIGFIPLPLSDETVEIFGLELPTLAIYAATSTLSVTLALAFMTWMFTHIEGIRWNGTMRYLQSWIPDVPRALLPMMIPLEILSQFMRLISLSVRLYANMLAGHMLILTFIGLIFLTNWLVFPLSVVFGTVFYLFEVVIVVTIQAYIFAALSAIYIGSAIEPEH